MLDQRKTGALLALLWLCGGCGTAAHLTFEPTASAPDLDRGRVIKRWRALDQQSVADPRIVVLIRRQDGKPYDACDAGRQVQKNAFEIAGDLPERTKQGSRAAELLWGSNVYTPAAVFDIKYEGRPPWLYQTVAHLRKLARVAGGAIVECALRYEDASRRRVSSVRGVIHRRSGTYQPACNELEATNDPAARRTTTI